MESQSLDLSAFENGESPESRNSEEENVASDKVLCMWMKAPDGLLNQDQQELSERVTHLEKRVREHQDEIVCLKGTIADVMRRLGHVETSKYPVQNSILPSRPFNSHRKPTTTQERPKSQLIESSSYTPPRSQPPLSARQTPKAASSLTLKKWGSSEETSVQNKNISKLNSSQLNHTNIKEPTWNSEEKYIRMHLKGRPVPLYAPSNVDEEVKYDVKAAQNPPPQELKLEWVYGYRGRDARLNLFTVPTGEVMYFTASVVVLHNIDEHTQRFYAEHTDDIKCIAIHPDQIKVATGQVSGHEKKEGKIKAARAGQKAHVRVWESINLTTLHVIGEGEFQRGICCVAFSKLDGGKQLLAVDENNDHILSIWDVSQNKAKKIVECKSSGDPVMQCEFHPLEENSIVCCGKSQISFWSIIDKRLEKKIGIFQKYEKPKAVICFCFANNGDIISGDSSGNLYVWEKGTHKITKAFPATHDGPVFSVCCTNDGSILSGGGKDRKICQWDSSYQKTGLEAEIPDVFGAVRVISQGRGNILHIGTIRNCILQGNMDLNFTPVVESHKDELWGLDTSPNRHQFLTCGYDKYIYLWDAPSHSVVWRKELGEAAHCCCLHPELEVAAIGLQTGKWNVIDLNTHEVIAVHTDGKEQVECIQYSQDGKLIAVGNRDNFIFVYEVSEDGKKYHKLGRCSGHSSYVTHIDWSTDGEIMRSNSGDYEVLYWKTKTCQQETSSDNVRNLEWATQNCTLSFNSVGVWPDGADGTDVNNCSVSHNKKLLVSADDYGKVNLYGYPCPQPRATGHIYGGHSSHVTNAKFLFDDSRVISTGGNDATVMQWQVIG